MMQISKALKTAALAGLFGLGALGAVSSPAEAHRVYTRCDSDGDRCWRVVCDNDGDDCRRYGVDTTYRYRDYLNNYGYYGNGYGDTYDRYYRRGQRRWLCDRDGDDCHWTYSRW
jgi:hypothetical protein